VLDVAELEQVLEAGDVRLVSVMTANNETGVLQPLGAVVERCDARGVFTHTDAVAAAPWCDLREITRGVDMVSLCAHKLGGPVNAGALVLRKGTLLEALTPGGGQERGRRGGTVDVAACVGLATALRLANAERELAWTEVGARRDALAARLTALEGVRVTAPSVAKLPGTLHLTFEGVASDELLFLLDRAGVCASAAASCSSGAAVASHVLAAMGMAPERARGSLRLSMGLENSAQECDDVATIIEATVARLRGRHVA
jgi:cysteine desulfurase